MNKMPFANWNSPIKAAAVAGYFAIVAIAVAFAWNVFSGISEQRASVSAAETMLAQIEERSSSGRKDGPWALGGGTDSPFLGGRTLSVAGATLLQRVASAVQRVGGDVKSSQVDLDSERAKAGWVGLLVSCDLQQKSLQQLLYDIEAGMPFLFVDQLVVQAPTDVANGGKVRVLMSVSGQWWNEK